MSSALSGSATTRASSWRCAGCPRSSAPSMLRCSSASVSGSASVPAESTASTASSAGRRAMCASAGRVASAVRRRSGATRPQAPSMRAQRAMKRSIGGRASGSTNRRRSGAASVAVPSDRSSPDIASSSGSSASRLLTITRVSGAASSRAHASTVCWAAGSRSSSTPPRITSDSTPAARSGAARQVRSTWRRRSSSTADHQRSSACAPVSPCHGPVRPSMQIDARVALPQTSRGIGIRGAAAPGFGLHRPSTRSCSRVHTPVRAAPITHRLRASSPSSQLHSRSPAPCSVASSMSSASGSAPRRSSRHSSCHATAWSGDIRSSTSTWPSRSCSQCR